MLLAACSPAHLPARNDVNNRPSDIQPDCEAAPVLQTARNQRMPVSGTSHETTLPGLTPSLGHPPSLPLSPCQPKTQRPRSRPPAKNAALSPELGRAAVDSSHPELERFRLRSELQRLLGGHIMQILASGFGELARLLQVCQPDSTALAVGRRNSCKSNHLFYHNLSGLRATVQFQSAPLTPLTLQCNRAPGINRGKKKTVWTRASDIVSNYSTLKKKLQACG